MKKIVDKETFKTKRITIRFSPSEFKRMVDKAKRAGTNPANYCREVSINGLITENANPYDLNEVRLLKQLLINYKTNFSRISNLISISNPGLYDEVREVKNRIEETLKRFNHDSKSKEQP